MKVLSLATVLAAIQAVAAQTLFTTLFVNDSSTAVSTPNIFSTIIPGTINGAQSTLGIVATITLPSNITTSALSTVASTSVSDTPTYGTITSGLLASASILTFSTVTSASVSDTPSSGPSIVTSSSPSIITTSTPSTVVVVDTVIASILTSTADIFRTEIFRPNSASSIPSLQILPSSTNSASSAASSISTSPASSTDSAPSYIITASSLSSTAASALATPNNGSSSNAKSSPDGTCGPEKGFTCLGSQNSPCCSSQGYCGATAEYCGKMVCQPDWGQCTDDGVKMIRHRHLNRNYWSRHA